MRYVYRCPECEIEKEVEHSIAECDTHQEPCLSCSVGRFVFMRRVPQPFLWGNSAWDQLAEKFDTGWRNYKAKALKRRGRGASTQKDYENVGGEVVEMRR